MSARSTMSSGSRGLPCSTDIIDLDRYMRAAVRPGLSSRQERRERLVVDAGGLCRKNRLKASNSSGGTATATATASASAIAGLPHVKRFSHDSGLSDGSLARYRHRSCRRASGETTTQRCRNTRGHGSTASLLAFRVACERALREQQEQIARVAELCERLGEQRNERRGDKRCERRTERSKPVRAKFERAKLERTRTERSGLDRVKPKRPKAECSTSSVESSDITSSSRSARERRTDKHRSDECKTYKIIMNKLDELSLLFAARRHVAPADFGAKKLLVLPRGISSGSVSVSDKIVATDPDLHACITSRHISPTVQILLTPRPTERAVGLQIHTKTTGTPPRSTGKDNVHIDSNRTDGNRITGPIGLDRRLAVTRAHFLEISPLRGKRPNITTESFVQRDVSNSDPIQRRLDRYNLEDPVRLYAQAKSLRTLNMRARRTRSEDRTLHNDRAVVFDQIDTNYPNASHIRGQTESLEEESFCTRCRNYWQALRQCFTNQLFGKPGRACAY